MRQSLDEVESGGLHAVADVLEDRTSSRPAEALLVPRGGDAAGAQSASSWTRSRGRRPGQKGVEPPGRQGARAFRLRAGGGRVPRRGAGRRRCCSRPHTGGEFLGAARAANPHVAVRGCRLVRFSENPRGSAGRRFVAGPSSWRAWSASRRGVSSASGDGGGAGAPVHLFRAQTPGGDPRSSAESARAVDRRPEKPALLITLGD